MQTSAKSGIDIAELELVVFHQTGESHISGQEMINRAEDAITFPGCQGWGSEQSDELLWRAEELPREWACITGPVIVFCEGAKPEEAGLNPRVPCLFWIFGEWRLSKLGLYYPFNIYREQGSRRRQFMHLQKGCRFIRYRQRGEVQREVL